MGFRFWLGISTLVLVALWSGYAIFLIYISSPITDVSLNSAAPFGDSFGIFSSLFAGLALIGLLYTIHLQAEELKLQREEMSKNVATQVRGLHFSMQELAINDTSGDLQNIWLEDFGSEQSFRQAAYVNLVLSHWEMQFQNGLMSKGQLVTAASRYMKKFHFQSFWINARSHRAAMAHEADNREAVLFHEILEIAYNNGFNRSPESSGPAKPDHSSGGAA